MMTTGWQSFFGTSGQTHATSCEPLRAAPRVRWAKTLKGSWPLTTTEHLVLTTGAFSHTTGAHVSTFADLEGRQLLGSYPSVVGTQLLVSHDDSLHALDLVTGLRRWSLSLEATGIDCTDHALVVMTDDRLEVFGAPDWRTAPTAKTWAAAATKGWQWNSTMVDQGVLFAREFRQNEPMHTSAFDLHSGAQRWRLPGDPVMADRLGCLLNHEGWWQLVTTDGRTRWRQHETTLGTHCLAMGELTLVFTGDAPLGEHPTINLVDRTTGETSHPRVGNVEARSFGECALAGENTIYGLTAPSQITAWSARGLELWTSAVPKLAKKTINQLVPFDGGLYARHGNHYTCLSA